MDRFQILLLAAAILCYPVATGFAGLLAKRGFPLQDEGNRLGCVDGLRGYLALSVMIHHFVIWMYVVLAGRPWGMPEQPLFASLGPGSVVLFFMITGFVFYPRILKGAGGFKWVATYVGRVFRIYPLVLFTIVLLYAISLLRIGIPPAVDWPAEARALQTWLLFTGRPVTTGITADARIDAQALWSLWYEWLFYLVLMPSFAVTVSVIRRRLPTWIIPVALILLPRQISRFLPEYVTFAFIPYFGFGMLAYELRRVPMIAGALAGRWAAGIAVLALLVAACNDTLPFWLTKPALYGLFFTTVACGNSLFGALTRPGAFVLGEVSFSIYVLHGLVLSVLFLDLSLIKAGYSAAAGIPLLALAAIAVVAVSATTYLGIEVPSINVGRRLSRRLGASMDRKGAPAEVIAP